MKLSQYKDDYYFYSGKASDVARTAAFAGIALIWVFKINGEPIPKLPNDLVLPAALFAAAIAFDLLQYLAGAAIWGAFHRYHEKQLKKPSDNPELSHPPYFILPIRGFFWLKQAAVLTGYGCVLSYLYRVWL